MDAIFARCKTNLKYEKWQKMLKVWSFIYTATAMYHMHHAPENETWFKNCGLYKVLKMDLCREKCNFVQRYFIVDEEFMFTWLHPLITTDLILPDRTPVSYWWNTAEICSGEAFIQLWVHHLVTRRFIMILHVTISSHVYPRISPKLPLILWPSDHVSSIEKI